MTNKFASFLILTGFILSLGITPAWSSEDETVANELTALLKASRAVLVQNKPLIKNPQKAGINVDKFLAITYKNYEKATGKKFKKGGGNVGKAQDQLITAIEQVVGDVVSGKDTALDPQGRFLPAIFARKAAARFTQNTGGKMALKLTTRDDYLVNASNKADAWEKKRDRWEVSQARLEKGETVLRGGRTQWQESVPPDFSRVLQERLYWLPWRQSRCQDSCQ